MTPSDRAPKYGGLTAAQLFEADRDATRNWSLDTADDMVFVNNPDEAVARFDLAFAQRALEDATVAIMARNALTDLLTALEAAEGQLTSVCETLSIEHKRTQALYNDLYAWMESDYTPMHCAGLAKKYPDLEAARAALGEADA